MKFVINGKFLSQNITGVQRYAREILAELDKIVDDKIDIEIAVPPNCSDIPKYKKIKAVKVGKMKGNIWEQLSLPLYVIKSNAICVNLCNMSPILTPHVVVVHDISFKVNRKFFSPQFLMWYNFVFSITMKKTKVIITDSKFSIQEIVKYYKIPQQNISLIYCSWQHFENIEYDNNTLKKYALKSGEYYFSMSSMAPNKNFKWIAENAHKNPDVTYVVSGSVNKHVFPKIFDFDVPKNMRFLGYVSDEEAKTLMRDCKAFLFPTFYEGFGIPPLEALSTGAKAVVSDASCMREIYGDSVYYVDPYNPDVNLDELLSRPTSGAEKVLNKYSWKKSAERLYQLLCDFVDRK